MAPAMHPVDAEKLMRAQFTKRCLPSFWPMQSSLQARAGHVDAWRGHLWALLTNAVADENQATIAAVELYWECAATAERRFLAERPELSREKLAIRQITAEASM